MEWTKVSFLFNICCVPFIPVVTALLEYRKYDFTFVWFLLYNFVAETLLLSNYQKALPSYLHTNFQVIPIVSLPCSCDKKLSYFT